MTRDAKVGLLLGLVFIFVIAFIINGLPGFGSRDDGNELTRNMASSPKSDPGIGTAAQKVTRDTITPIKPVNRVTPVQKPSQPVSNDLRPVNTNTTQQPFKSVRSRPQIRYTANLPQNNTADTQNQSGYVSLVVPKQENQSAVDRVLAQSRKQEPKPLKVEKKISRPKMYTVKEGDSLALIAKRHYGNQIGNKQATIDAIFKANRKILKSPDSIYIGQKLVLPVISQGKSTSSRVQPVVAQTKTNGSFRYYTVKDGDSLWNIAESELNNGTRYTEIIKLNKFENEDMLKIGMRIKLPKN